MSNGAKHYVFTLNNPTEPLVFDPSWMECLSYQLERAPETGTFHFQGALSLKKRKRITSLRRLFCDRAHYEVMRGKPIEAHDYANKEDTRVPDNESPLAGSHRFGDVPAGQGERSDLQKICEEILSGIPMRTVAREHPVPYVRYHAGLERLQRIAMDRTRVPLFDRSSFKREFLPLDLPVVLYGGTGLGKTQFALAHFENALKIDDLDQLEDFDPQVHDGLVFDDMDFNNYGQRMRIHLTDVDEDRYIRIRYKLAKIPRGTRRIFTHNEPSLFDNPTDDLSRRQAIHRRLNFVEIKESLF